MAKQTDNTEGIMSSDEIKRILGTKKKEEPGSKEKHIVPLKGEDSISVVTNAVKIRNAIVALQAAEASGQRCQGVVIGALPGREIEGLENSDKRDMMFARVLYDQCITVSIPSPMFISDNLLPKRKVGSLEDRLRRDRYFITDRSGAVVDFKVVGVIDKAEHSLVFGDRVSAMKEIRKDDLLPKGDTPAKYGEGSLMEGRVTFVQRAKMGVEVRGFEKILSNRDVTYDYLPSLQDRYMAGDKIALTIKKVYVEGEGADADVVDLELDGKDNGTDMRDIACANLPEGTIMPGKVTKIVGGEHPAVYVEHLHAPWYVRCRPPRFIKKQLMVDDIVTVTIIKREVAEKHVYGRITAVYGQRGDRS